MDEVAVEHTSSSLQQTQTGRVRTPGPPTSFSLSFSLPATVRLPWNHSSLVTPCDPDIPCQVPWVYRNELVFGIEPYPPHFRSVSVSTLTAHSINLPWDFHAVGRVCRLRAFCRFSGGMLFLCFCAWRISSNRYKIKRNGVAGECQPHPTKIVGTEPKRTTPTGRAGEIPRKRNRQGFRLVSSRMDPRSCGRSGYPAPPVTRDFASQANRSRFDCLTGNPLPLWRSTPGFC